MEDKNKILEGDIVSVHFEHCEIEPHLEIIDFPYATGDSWKCRRLDGTLVYIQNYTKMILIEKSTKHKSKLPSEQLPF